MMKEKTPLKNAPDVIVPAYREDEEKVQQKSQNESPLIDQLIASVWARLRQSPGAKTNRRDRHPSRSGQHQ